MRLLLALPFVPKSDTPPHWKALRKQVAVPRPRWRLQWAELLRRSFEVDGNVQLVGRLLS